MATIKIKAIRRYRVLASAMFLSAILTVLLVPAYGQQEVDPTWYDPTPDAVAVQPAHTAAVVYAAPATLQQHPLKAKSASAAPNTAKLHAKNKQLDQNRHNAAHKTTGTPAAENRLPAEAEIAGFDACQVGALRYDARGGTI